MVRRAHGWRSLWRADDALAAVEFALSLPLLVLLCLGGFEMSRQLLIALKLEKTAYTVADIASQGTTLGLLELGNDVNAAAKIMLPYDFTNNGTVIVSSVLQTGILSLQNPPLVLWQYQGGGLLARSSQVGHILGPATLPNGLTLGDKDDVIVSEAYFHYVPIFGLGIFSAKDLYRAAVFKPRLGALITTPA